MQYRTLGKTGLKVSAVGFGGIPIQRIDAADAGALLRYAAKQGINYIDTARGYTVSEQYIGEGIEGMRDSFVLATKSMSRSHDAMAKDIETSLANLRTDYIDLYQMHNPREEDLATVFGEGGAASAIREAIAAGKVGHMGATAHSLAVFLKLLDYPEIETIMFPYNIVESQGEAAMKLAAERGVGFVAMKPLAGGNITDGRLAMRYLLANPHCTIAIPGMATVEELDQNVSAVDDSSPLSAEELAAIEKIRTELAGNFCRRCGYCAPCAKGIDIPGCFTLGHYKRNYGLGDWALARYDGMTAKAGDCIDCGACEKRCPYDLPIREMLADIKTLFGK